MAERGIFPNERKREKEIGRNRERVIRKRTTARKYSERERLKDK